MIDWRERQRRALGRDREEITKTFTITGDAEIVKRVERFLAFVQYLGNIGHSCVAGMYVDGDGADRIKISEEMPKIKESDVKVKGTYPDQWENVGGG